MWFSAGNMPCRRGEHRYVEVCESCQVLQKTKLPRGMMLPDPPLTSNFCRSGKAALSACCPLGLGNWGHASCCCHMCHFPSSSMPTSHPVVVLPLGLGNQEHASCCCHMCHFLSNSMPTSHPVVMLPIGAWEPGTRIMLLPRMPRMPISKQQHVARCPQHSSRPQLDLHTCHKNLWSP